jgi:DNA-binding transcriptional ArsR family regulator
MLDALITSRTRARLLDLLIKEPSRRHYLRGLERELGESATPIRRELLRLERLGLLTASDEGNMRYYALNTQSPLYAQLVAATGLTPAEPVSAPASPAEVAPTALERRPKPVRRVAVGAIVVAVMVVTNVAAASYVGWRMARLRTAQEVASDAFDVRSSAGVARAVRQEASVTEMQSPRFRVVPGTW